MFTRSMHVRWSRGASHFHSAMSDGRPVKKKSKRKTKSSLLIPKKLTANVTDSIRADMTAEVFENNKADAKPPTGEKDEQSQPKEIPQSGKEQSTKVDIPTGGKEVKPPPTVVVPPTEPNTKIDPANQPPVVPTTVKLADASIEPKDQTTKASETKTVEPVKESSVKQTEASKSTQEPAKDETSKTAEIKSAEPVKDESIHPPIPKSASKESSNSTDSSSNTSETLTKTAVEEPDLIVMPEVDVIDYENELLSIYENTGGTQSMDSIPTITVHDLLKTEIEKLKPVEDETMELVEYPTIPGNLIRTSKRISHPHFVRITQDPRTAFPMTEVHWGHGVAEQNFIRKLMSEIQSMVDECGRSDLELQFSCGKESNGLPRLNIQLVPRSEPNPPNIRQLNKFRMEKFLMKNKLAREKFLTEDKVEVSNLPKYNIFNSFRRGIARIVEVLNLF